jgi:hypothetical protein
LKVKEENSRTQIRIHWSEARIRGSGSKMSRIHKNVKKKIFSFLLGHISFQLLCDCPRKWDTRRSEERSDPNRRKSLKHINIKSKIYTVNYFVLQNINFYCLRTSSVTVSLSTVTYTRYLLLRYLLFPCPVLTVIEIICVL